MSSTTSENDDHGRPPYWCDVCQKDIQSAQAMKEHIMGRSHIKKSIRMRTTINVVGLNNNINNKNSNTMATTTTHTSTMTEREINKHIASMSELAPIDEEELFDGMKDGTYENIIVMTGAGISTSAGVPDYRSSGGFFNEMMTEYSHRFPEVDGPETLFSRWFVTQHPAVWKDEILTKKHSFFQNRTPTDAHRFCAYLHRRGILKRVYTQNVDGLHLHPSLEIPAEKVVECHGSFRQPDTLVLYGDELPPTFTHHVNMDFFPNNDNSNGNNGMPDLVIVMGTSLQVAPFCGLPNMMPKGSTRVLVNRQIAHCLQNSFSSKKSTYISTSKTMSIGHRKDVKLYPLWSGREGRKRYRQLLAESDCDEFVRRFCERTGEDLYG